MTVGVCVRVTVCDCVCESILRRAPVHLLPGRLLETCPPGCVDEQNNGNIMIIVVRVATSVISMVAVSGGGGVWCVSWCVCRENGVVCEERSVKG